MIRGGGHAASTGARGATATATPCRVDASAWWRAAPSAPRALAILLPLLLLQGALMARTAWLSDDAYVSFRTVANLVAGEGPRWNLHERVQAFTNPLWTFALVVPTAAWGDVFVPALAASMLCSLGVALVVALGIARTAGGALVGVGALVVSRAFMDYSTSGLENAPAHLLLAAFLALAWRGRAPAPPIEPTGPPVAARSPDAFPWLCFLAALVALNRLDHALLVAPSLVLGAWGRRRQPRRLALGAVAFAPLGAWLVFATWYFGAPFPNTAYAKLATGIGAGESALQGLHYLLDSVAVDPATLATIALALFLAARAVVASIVSAASAASTASTMSAAQAADAARLAAPLVGVVVYLAYTIKVGGDFMSGRFLAAPLLVAAAALARLLDAAPPRAPLAVAALLLASVLATPRHHLLAPDPPSRPPRLDWWRLSPSRVADERMFYQPATGLFQARPRLDVPDHPWVRQAMEEREDVVVRGAIGYYGYFAPPDRIILDEMGLSDPFLARLPIDRRERWRVGHYIRDLPAGYVASVATRRNLLADERLAAFYDVIVELTRGDLSSGARLRTILRFHRGAWNRLLPAPEPPPAAPPHVPPRIARALAP